MNSRRLIVAPEGQQIVATFALAQEECPCPLWVKADICSAISHVRFTPNSDRKSGFPHKVMPALPPKADIRLRYFAGVSKSALLSEIMPPPDIVCLGKGRSSPRRRRKIASFVFEGH
jgi:hypothetical protein